VMRAEAIAGGCYAAVRMPALIEAIGHAGPVTVWLGVDVGAKRKGLHAAVVDHGKIQDLAGGLDRNALIELADLHRPAIVAVDSPRRCALEGHTVREEERSLAKLICGIRWTPDERRVRSSDYYAWIVEGLELFEALTARRFQAIEVFPTASFTRWHGARGQRSRSSWSREGLARMALEGMPSRTNQDQRDAVAAAVTARQHSLGRTQLIGEIVVPTDRW
jgi:predicted nuclease with RNAse H fold